MTRRSRLGTRRPDGAQISLLCMRQLTNAGCTAGAPNGGCGAPVCGCWAICETKAMDELVAAVITEAVAVLRQAGARFAYLHGSRAAGRERPDSDIDIAAHFGGRPPNSFDLLMPAGVDLLVLDDAPLELAGRVAVGGRLLFDDDPVARVRWEAMTRKIYFDELPRITRAHREFAAAVTARGR
jgi:predicted nucleotidyltransferase